MSQREILSLPNKFNRQKYRPVFSASLLKHMEVLARADYMKTSSADSLQIVGILAPFIAKIEAGSINPAYSEKQPVNFLLEALGGTLDTKEHISKEKYWELCYERSLLEPKECTIAEINAANEHRYLHGLMSEKEIKDFESRIASKDYCNKLNIEL